MKKLSNINSRPSHRHRGPPTVLIVIPPLLVFPSAHQLTAHTRPPVCPPAAVTYIPASPGDPENRRPSDCIRVFLTACKCFPSAASLPLCDSLRKKCGKSWERRPERAPRLQRERRTSENSQMLHQSAAPAVTICCLTYVVTRRSRWNILQICYPRGKEPRQSTKKKKKIRWNELSAVHTQIGPI